MRSSCVPLSAALLVLALGANAATGAIRITDSRYENGVLTIAGQANANDEVTLDGRFTTRADGTGHFSFTENYRPPTCMSDIRAGDDSYSAIVTNCLLGDAAAATADNGRH